MLGYAELPRLLRFEQPVYGLQSVGLDGTRRPLERIEDIAEVFLDEIRNAQPHGPYQLAGFCIGAIVAFEIAQRLLARGQEVSLLALIEAWPPGHVPVYPRDNFMRRALSRLSRVPRHLRTAASLPPRQAFDYLRQRLTTLRKLVASSQLDPSDQLDHDRDLVLRANHRAASRYRPSRYRGRIVIVVPVEEQVEATDDPRLFWGTLADKGAQVVRVSGHSGNLLERPHVERLAETLGGQLLESRLA